MFCAKCGTSLPDGASVCPSCGVPISPETTTAQATAADPIAPTISITDSVPAPAAAPSAETAAAAESASGGAAEAAQTEQQTPAFQQVTYIPDKAIYSPEQSVYGPRYSRQYYRRPLTPNQNLTGYGQSQYYYGTGIQGTAMQQSSGSPAPEAAAPAQEAAPAEQSKLVFDENGYAYDENGYAYDQYGFAYDQNGYVYDQLGNVYDQDGNLIEQGAAEDQSTDDYSQTDYGQTDYGQSADLYGDTYNPYNWNSSYLYGANDPSYGAYDYDPNMSYYGEDPIYIQSQKQKKKKKVKQGPGMKWFKFLIYFHFFFFAVTHIIYGVFLLIDGIPKSLNLLLDHLRGMEAFATDGQLLESLGDIFGEIFGGMRTFGIILGALAILCAVYGIVVRVMLAKYKQAGPKMLTIFFILRIVVKIVANGLAVYLFAQGFIVFLETFPYEALVKIVPFAIMIPSALVSLLVLILNTKYFKKRKELFDK